MTDRAIAVGERRCADCGVRVRLDDGAVLADGTVLCASCCSDLIGRPIEELLGAGPIHESKRGSLRR